MKPMKIGPRITAEERNAMAEIMASGHATYTLDLADSMPNEMRSVFLERVFETLSRQRLAGWPRP